MGIIISQYKDPYKPISTMECHPRVLKAAQSVVNVPLRIFHVFPRMKMFGGGLVRATPKNAPSTEEVDFSSIDPTIL